MLNTDYSGMKGLWRKFSALNGSVVFLALIVYIVAVSLLGPAINPKASGKFLTLSSFIMTIRQTSALGIISCALTLVVITGNIDLSVGSIYTLCACICARSLEKGLPAGILMPLLVGAACGLFNGLCVSTLKLNAFLTTLATMSIFASTAILYTGSNILTPVNSSAEVVDAFKFIGQGSVAGIPAPILIFAVTALVLMFLLRRTSYGTRLYLIGANPVGARFSGIAVRREVTVAYMIAGLCSALAAVVTVSRNMSAQAQMGNGMEMSIILAVVMGGTAIQGGKGSVFGTVIGVLFIAFLGNGFTFLGIDNSYTQNIISGIILIFALSMDILRERGVRLWKRS